MIRNDMTTMTGTQNTQNTQNVGSRTARRQRGSILLVSLIILLLLTILGVTALNNVTMEERMAGNLRDGNLAFQAAEAALRAGENWLAAETPEPAKCTSLGSTCSTVWSESVLPDLSYQEKDWWIKHGHPYKGHGIGAYLTGGDTADDGPHDNDSFVATAPRFIIQFQNFVPYSLDYGNTEGELYYLITAHGFGGSDDAESVLQTSFTKRF